MTLRDEEVRLYLYVFLHSIPICKGFDTKREIYYGTFACGGDFHEKFIM